MLTLPTNTVTYLAGDTTWPIRLYEIGGNPTLYYTNADVDVEYNSQVYTARGINYSKVVHEVGYSVDSFVVAIDNVDDALIAWYLTNDPTGYTSKAFKGWTDGTLNGSSQLTLLDDYAVELFRGRNTSFKAAEEFELTIKSQVDLHKQRGPRVLQHTTCRFQGVDGFKGANCGYSGSETECDYTFRRCKELSNEARFGGFPDISSKTDS